MDAIKMMVGEYRNIDCTIDLADVCDNVSRLVKHFRADAFMDFAGMRDIMNACEPTRRIWSIWATGTWYMDVKEYNEVVMAHDPDPIMQFLVESNADGEMTFTRIR